MNQSNHSQNVDHKMVCVGCSYRDLLELCVIIIGIIIAIIAACSGDIIPFVFIHAHIKLLASFMLA